MFIKKNLFRTDYQYKIDKTTTDLINILTPSQEERFKQLFTQESFWGMVRKNKFEWTTGPSDRHPNEKAHQKWAERIVKDYGNVLGTKLRTS
jgi:lysophospholipase L1-like esterase